MDEANADAVDHEEPNAESENFTVAVRVRPLNARELEAGSKTAWKVKGDTITSKAADSRESSFNFRHVFDEKSTTQGVYDSTTKGVVEATMQGFNGTVFAYGQTSSGKTHTMMGTNDNPGILPLAIRDLFAHVRKTFDREFLIRVSYLEIYQECIRDLFQPANADMKVHEHPQQGFYVKATGIVVSSEEQILKLMERGQEHRHVGQTNMNEQSSRSHTIFRITIESKVEMVDENADPDDDEDEVTAGPCGRG